MMMAKKGPAPKGPFGGSTDTDEGWIGDQSESDQVKAFEAATDYLFFQGPAPKTAVQEDLPSFFSAENLAELEIPTAALVVAATGIGSFAVASSIILGGSIDLPKAPEAPKAAAQKVDPEAEAKAKAKAEAKAAADKAAAEAKAAAAAEKAEAKAAAAAVKAEAKAAKAAAAKAADESRAAKERADAKKATTKPVTEKKAPPQVIRLVERVEGTAEGTLEGTG